MRQYVHPDQQESSGATGGQVPRAPDEPRYAHLSPPSAQGGSRSDSKRAAFLEIRDVHKSFAGVKALNGITATIERGQIYHLIGENGCGKSTLIKIISGALHADEGSLVIEGREVRRLSAIEALCAGIQTVYQDLSLLPNLSVSENIGLTQQLAESRGRLGRRLALSRLNDTAVRALTAVNLPVDRRFLSTRTDELPIATRQLVAIARAIATDAKLVIMDEPTTALTRHEVENLIRVLAKLRSEGVAILFVTHKLDECKSIGGRVIVVRDGRKVMEGDIAQHTKSELSYWMTGKVLDDSRYRRARMDSRRLLAVHDFGRNRYFDGVSFSLNRGEILGITGLLDSGRNELALALAGVSPADHGGVEIEGSNVRLSRPTDAIAAGIGYVPEDRLSEGLFLEKSIRDNIVAEVVGRLLSRFGMIDKRRSRAFADGIADELQIAAPNLDEPVQSLSGGNQQRVLIGRGLAVKPKLLILHGPTVGVDVGSKDTIYRIMQKLAVEGIGIIVISDDLPELLSNCDRVLVMRKGTVAETFDAESTSEDVLYRALVAEQPTRSLS